MELLRVSHHKSQPPWSTSYTKATNDHELISAFQQGDQSAFECLFLKYKDRVFYQCMRKVGDYAESADLAQEVFLKVFRSLNGFTFKSGFSSWIYRIATNTCIDHIRRRRRRPLLELGSEDTIEREPNSCFRSMGPDPEQEASQTNFWHRIKWALSQIPAKNSSTFLLREIEGFSYREIADFCRVSVNTIKSRNNRAKRALKEILAEYGEV